MRGAEWTHHDVGRRYNDAWVQRIAREMEIVAWVSVGVAILCAAWIGVDVIRHPQKMSVMNVVWPVTALYFSVAGVWFYWRFGRATDKQAKSKQKTLTVTQVATGTSHCGAGCMIADVVCAFWIAAARFQIWGSPLWAEFAIDLVAAWGLGIVFQYFAIKPMKEISAAQALIAAIKADTLSIIAFQVGMYAWMALAYFKFYPQPHLTAFSVRYWLMMQIGMICGFMTSYPMNRWLIEAGFKEAM